MLVAFVLIHSVVFSLEQQTKASVGIVTLLVCFQFSSLYCVLVFLVQLVCDALQLSLLLLLETER